jgi:hypothetical protein
VRAKPCKIYFQTVNRCAVRGCALT